MPEENTYRDYWTQVDNIGAEAVAEAIENSNDAQEAEDAVYEFIDQSVDGSYWVIYYHAAAKTLDYTENGDAFFEAGVGGQESWESYGDVLTALAYWALRADVMDRLPDDWQEKLEEAFEEED